MTMWTCPICKEKKVKFDNFVRFQGHMKSVHKWKVEK